VIEVRIERVFEVVIGDTSAKLGESEARELATCLAAALAMPAKAARQQPGIFKGATTVRPIAGVRCIEERSKSRGGMWWTHVASNECPRCGRAGAKPYDAILCGQCLNEVQAGLTPRPAADAEKQAAKADEAGKPKAKRGRGRPRKTKGGAQ
jgi:hypothetical protein